MLAKTKIKLIRQLEQKKFRQTQNLFIVEGEKNIIELIKSNLKIKELFALNSFLEVIDCSSSDFQITKVSEKELSQISRQKTPNKALALVHIPEETNILLNSNELYLALDSLQDPGNLGTIIRSASWFGISTIFCSPDTVDAYNNKVVQSAMGALFSSKIIYTSLPELFAQAKTKKIPIIGTTLRGKNIYDCRLEKNGIILMGNESKGISNNLVSFLDVEIKIPFYGKSNACIESLNVAIATSVVLSEFKRKSSLRL